MTDQATEDIFALLVHRANEVTADSAKIGHSLVSMPSSYPAYHLLEKFGKIPEGGRFVEREFAHLHAAFLPDDHPTAKAKKARGEPWQAYQGGGLGSMHVSLALKDAAAVIDAGWGEPHLLAGSNMVPWGIVLVYAPRDPEEVEVVISILQASLQNAKGGA